MTPAQEIFQTVFEYYLETGQALDSSAISQRLGWSLSKTRRIFRDAGGTVDGLEMLDSSRYSRSKSYPGMTVGSHRVSVYIPTLEALRNIILGLRGTTKDGMPIPCYDSSTASNT